MFYYIRQDIVQFSSNLFYGELFSLIIFPSQRFFKNFRHGKSFGLLVFEDVLAGGH